MPYHCAARDCHNGTYRLHRWMKGMCETHQCHYGTSRCICEPPFRLYAFPTELRDPTARQKWREAINRGDPKKPWILFDPSKDLRVCSIHFVDGKPTEGHPHPELHLGYKMKSTKPGVISIRPPSKRKTLVKCPFKSLTSSVDSLSDSNIEFDYIELDSDLCTSNKRSPPKSKQKSFVKSPFKPQTRSVDPSPDSNTDLDSDVCTANKTSPSKSKQKSSVKIPFKSQNSSIGSHSNIQLILDKTTLHETLPSKPKLKFKYLVSAVGSPPYSNIELVSDKNIANETPSVSKRKRTFKYLLSAVEPPPPPDSNVELVSDKFISNEISPISKRKRTLKSQASGVGSSPNSNIELVSTSNEVSPVSKRKWTFKYYDGSVREFKSSIDHLDQPLDSKIEMDSNKCTSNILSQISNQKFKLPTRTSKQQQTACEISVNMPTNSLIKFDKDACSSCKISTTSTHNAAFNIWCLLALQCWLTMLVVCLFGFVRYFQEKVGALQKENRQLLVENQKLHAVIKMLQCNQVHRPTSGLHGTT